MPLYRKNFKRITISPLRFERRHLSSELWWHRRYEGQSGTQVEECGFLFLSDPGTHQDFFLFLSGPADVFEFLDC